MPKPFENSKSLDAVYTLPMTNPHISSITNDDGKTGMVTNTNTYHYTDDYLSKYKLLNELSKKPATKSITTKAGGTSGKQTEQIADIRKPGILNFLSKMEKFNFAPPSDNLWVVTIDTMVDKTELIKNQNTNETTISNGLSYLYKSITKTNERWSNIVTTNWKINTDDLTKNDKNAVNNYMNQFISESGIFLAQNINFTPHGVAMSQSPFTQGQQHGSFFNFGFTTQNRSLSNSLKISFLVSNWDVGDLLFDPWIAAVAQRGLIEQGGSSGSIKAKIIVKQYSSGVPKEKNSQKVNSVMKCRKEYIFYDCVPINRGSVQKKYDFNDAGTFKNSIVQFKYLDYQIKYHF